MGPCPHCGAAIPVCPTCGKSLSEHAPPQSKRKDHYDGSDERLGGYSHMGAADLETGSLELEVDIRPGPSKPPAHASAAEESPMAKPVSLRAAPSGAISSKPPASGPHSGSPPASGTDIAVGKAALGSVAEAVSLLEQKPPVIDPMEAKLLGRFGRPPTKIWEMPAYSNMVRQRVGELEDAVEAKQAMLAKSEAQLADALVRISRKAAEVAPTLTRQAKAPYVHTLDTLRRAEEAVAGAEGALAAESGAQAEKLRALDQRIAEFSREYEAAWEKQRRAGDKAPPDVRRVVEEARQKLAIVKEEREAVAMRVNPATRTPAQEAAMQELRAVCARFAEHVILDEINFGKDFHALRDEIVRLARAVEAGTRDVALHRAAIRTHDEGAVQKGQLVVKGGLIGVIVFIVLVVGTLAAKCI